MYATYYAETVLGVNRESTSLHQASSYDTERNALMMNNGYHPDFNTRFVFLRVLGGEETSWSADRRSLLRS